LKPNPALAECLEPGWVERELQGASFGDLRRQLRCEKMLTSFFNKPRASIPEACGSPGESKAAYRFLDNPSVSAQEILSSHRQQLVQRMAEVPVVLAVQDTSSFNHSSHPDTGSLGPIATRADGPQGFLLHTTMAYTPAAVPLGILASESWARDPEQFGKKATRHQRPIEQKESYKWLQSFQACQQLQPQLPHTQIISIGDRESDLYELLQLAQPGPGVQLLIRAQHDRQLLGPEELVLWDFMASQPQAGTLWLQLTKTPQRAARQAELAVRYAAVTLKPPAVAGSKANPLFLHAIWAEELHPPAGVEPVSWMLLTTLLVTSFAEAVEKLHWYAIRWNIEVFHKILKSGCQAEARQLKEFQRLQRCLALDLLVAWRIQLLLQLGRQLPDLPASAVFSTEEWQALYCFIHKTSLLPAQEPTLQEAMRMVGKLGGFLGRKRDGQPGVTTLWRGFQRLSDITLAWTLFHFDRPPP